MTALNSVPAPAADVELQVGVVPGYYLSDAVQPDAHGGGMEQASLMLEPDELIHVKGLSVGARSISGAHDDGYFEPMLRYRHWLDHGHYLALAVVGYGTHASGSSSGASYTMTHGGGEVAFDLGVDHSPWIELHLQGGGSVSGLSASGRYCSGGDGWGVDCPDGNVGDSYGHVDGAFPAIFGGFSLDFGRHLGVSHGVRLALLGAAGQMPVLQRGNPERSSRGWSSAGVSLTVAFGAAGHKAE